MDGLLTLRVGATALGFGALSYLVRSLPRWAGIGGSDAWFHLDYVREIRANGHRVPERFDRYHFEAPATYPWLFHWMLARLPDRALRGLLPRLGSVVSGLTAVTLFLAVRALPLGGADPYLAAVAASAVYLTVPMASYAWSGVHTVSERPLGVLLTFASTWGAALFLASGEPAAAAVAVAACAAAYLTSKFAMQALALGLPGLSLVTLDVAPLALWSAGLAAAWLVTGGRAGRVWRGHLDHLGFYRRVMQHRHVAVRHRNIGLLRALRLALRERSRKALLAAASNPILRALAYGAVVVACPLAWSGAGGSVPPAGVEALAAAGTLALAGCVVVASVPGLRFLGEADRYVYYLGILPACVVAGWALATAPTGPTGLYALAAALFSLPLLAADLYVRGGGERSPDPWERASAFRRSVEEPLRARGVRKVLCVPGNMSAFVRFATEMEVVSWAHPRPEEYDDWNLLFPDYFPYPNHDLTALKDHFGFGAVLVFGNYVDESYLEDWRIDVSYDLEPWEPVARWEDLRAYVPPKASRERRS